MKTANSLKKICTLLVLSLAFSEELLSQPTITTITPTSGPIGTTVTIAGANFSSTPSFNTVFFGAVKAKVLSATSTSLVVKVPLGTTYQPLSVALNQQVGYAAKPFIVTFGSDSVITSNSFAPRIQIVVGNSPSNVAIGDLDGDGKTDMAIANVSSVSLHRNITVDSAIQFSDPIMLPEPIASQVVSLADLNGDGKLDVVATSYGSIDELMIFKNSSTVGVLSFEQPIKLRTSPFVREIAIKDLDLDGRADIVFVNQASSNNVSIYRNTTSNGNLSFSSRVDFTAGMTARGVTLSDLDSDGKWDLIVSNNDAGTISVFKNKSTSGNLSFDPKVDLKVGDRVEKVAVGDIDADGKEDVIVADSYDNRVAVFRNSSLRGALTLEPPVYFATGLDPYNVCISDLNGDGKLDIIASNYGEKSISILKNQSSLGLISFGAKVNYSTLTYSSRGLAVGDFDNDGRPDIVIANSGDVTVSILINKIGQSIILNSPDSNHSVIRVYPNPATAMLTIDTLNAQEHWERIDLFTTDGKYLASYSLANKIDISINVEPFASGTYFLVLRRKNGRSITKKFIKHLK